MLLLLYIWLSVPSECLVLPDNKLSLPIRSRFLSHRLNSTALPECPPLKVPGGFNGVSPATYHVPETFSLFPPTPSPHTEEISNVPGCRYIPDLLHPTACARLVQLAESLGFARYDTAKNQHEGLQILMSEAVNSYLYTTLRPHLPLYLPGSHHHRPATLHGINRRWRIYKYAGTDTSNQDSRGGDKFSPHIDAGWPESGEHNGGLVYDVNANSSVRVGSRFSVLLYLTSDFDGGCTTFFPPALQSDGHPSESESPIAEVVPSIGGVLLIPQALGEEEMMSHHGIPLHEGSRVTRGLKYVIRTDVLYRHNGDVPSKLTHHEDTVRDVMKPQDPILASNTFLKRCESLYEPVMGVENMAPFLAAFVKLTKPRQIVEIGSGYTSLFLLAAMKENEMELSRIKKNEGSLRLLDYPWTTVGCDTAGDIWETVTSPRLRCVDNMLHQRETASQVENIAASLGLDGMLEMFQGDAFDLSASLKPNSVDLLWCDFGVGKRVSSFMKMAYQSVQPGGFVLLHSTLTNSNTRQWVEKLRAGAGEDETGVPNGEFEMVSLLERHKRFQNSITILQRRGSNFSEPLYSEYA